MTAEAAARGGPIGERDRAAILDILRGFALLGIFVAHVPGFSGWDTLPAADHAMLDPGSDGALQFLRDAFVRGKFYSLFSLLFGFGFEIQRASAARRGASFGRLFRRRQLGLLAIGLVHSAFWHGDILLTYALLGLLLIPCADWSARRMLQWALGAFALRAVWGVVVFACAGALAGVGESAVGDGAGGVDVMGSVSAVAAGYYGSDWLAMLSSNAHFLALKWLLVLYEGRLLSIGGCFLLGAALGKWRVHRRLAEFEPALRRTVVVAGGLGLLGNLALAALWPVVPTYPPTALGALVNLVVSLAVPALALALAAAVSLAWLRGVGARFWRLFAAPGRMALTTYLSQTAIGIAVFYGVGLGLRGTLSLTEGVAFAFASFAFQMLLAAGWLKAFRYGPVEWAWRCVTYGRVLPLRRDAAGIARAAPAPPARSRSQG